MGQKHVEFVRSSLDGWNRGDVDAWLRAAHPEIEWVSEVVRRVEGLARKVRAYLDPQQALAAVGLAE